MRKKYENIINKFFIGERRYFTPENYSKQLEYQTYWVKFFSSINISPGDISPNDLENRFYEILEKCDEQYHDSFVKIFLNTKGKDAEELLKVFNKLDKTQLNDVLQYIEKSFYFYGNDVINMLIQEPDSFFILLANNQLDEYLKKKENPTTTNKAVNHNHDLQHYVVSAVHVSRSPSTKKDELNKVKTNCDKVKNSTYPLTVKIHNLHELFKKVQTSKLLRLEMGRFGLFGLSIEGNTTTYQAAIKEIKNTLIDILKDSASRGSKLDQDSIDKCNKIIDFHSGRLSTGLLRVLPLEKETATRSKLPSDVAELLKSDSTNMRLR